MARKYCEYLSVDTNFIPVFSASQDSSYPNKWKSFFPHDSFKSIMSQLIDTLEMNSVEKNRPLWISGAYGTGKTYASFVIKHILEDDLVSVKAYFDSNNMTALYARLSGVRSKGKTVVVHRSSSSGIVGENRLINCIRESIKSALRDNGCVYIGQKSQYDIILSTLKDPQSAFNFANAFSKYKAKFTDYSTPESVIRDLEELDLDGQLDLLDTIVDIAEKENYVWHSTASELINWIDDVVKGNDLHSLIFVWDEFTEFFRNNQNNITGLQELAQASARIKFYFFLITHSTASQLIADQNARKIIEARFKLAPIEMADTTAFKLLGQAIKTSHDLHDEWKEIVSYLWQKVGRITKETLINFSTDHITEEELQKLLPLHPFAANLLKFISQYISSNQRTMFQFLSGEYISHNERRNNFRWFIDHFSNEQGDWNYLTANFIWDYFFIGENVDFDEAFKTIIGHYNNFKNICGDDTKKEAVLKVALLLTALQQKSGADRGRGNLSSLLRPTLANISACFVGTPIQSSIVGIMAEFVSKTVFGKVEEGNDTLYVTTYGNIDEERFNKMKDEIQRELVFEKLLSDTTYNVYGRFLPTKESAKQRFVITPITPSYDKNSVERLMHSKPNVIPMLFMFVKNEVEQARVKTSIGKLYAEHSGREFVVVDFSGQIFTDALYEKFIHSKTEERYYSSDPNQRQQSNLAKRNAQQIVDEWINKLDTTSLDVYTTANQISKIQGGLNLRQKMDEITAAVFGCGLERIATLDKLFSPQGFQAQVVQCGMSVFPIPSGTYSILNQIATILTNEGIWTNPNYYRDNPAHPVSQMKIAVEKVIADGFSKNNKVAVSEIWSILIQKPFGLQNNCGSAFLVGFLLKEYIDNRFHKYDGANPTPMDHSVLSDLIFGIIKGNPKVNGQFIMKQTPEHIEFCRITGGIFKIAADKQTSIEAIAQNIRIFLKSNDHPLWTLKSYIKDTCEDNELFTNICKTINLFCEFVSAGNIAGRDKTRIAEDIHRLYKENAGLSEELAKIITPQNLKAGMQSYIQHHKPELVIVTTKIGIGADEYVLSLNRKLSADSSYLWEIGDTNRQIDVLLEDYILIDAVNALLSEAKKSLDKTIEALRVKLNLIKIPHALILTFRPDLTNIFKTLFSIQSNTVYNKVEAAEIVACYAEKFNTFFNNQYTLFSDIARAKLEPSLSNDEIDVMFRTVGSGILSEKSDIYIQNISMTLDKFRKDKKINKLFTLWKDATCTDSPKAWSELYVIPIICLFQGERDVLLASKVFDIVNKTHIPGNASDVDEAINFITSGILDKLIDIERCNAEFKKYFSGVYDAIVDDIEDLKVQIKQSLNGSVYEWTAKKSTIDVVVKRLAEKQYAEVYKEKVKQKIRQLSPEKAQRFLEELVEDKPLVGINILQG